MALTDINIADPLVQQTFGDHLRDKLGWDGVYAYNAETFGPNGTLGRANEREAVGEMNVVYRIIRAGFDDNLTVYLHEYSIAHPFHHNAFLVAFTGRRGWRSVH